MANLVRRQNSVQRILGSVLAPAASYTVTAYKVGAQVASASSGTTITVRAGHGFAAMDKLINGTDATTFRAVQSVTATTVAVDTALSVAIGDVLINLGPDTGTTSPNYDGSPLSIYSDMAGAGSATSQARVTTASDGEYGYWHKGLDIWELIRDSSGTPVDYVVGAAENSLGQTSYGVRYMNRYATGGTGTSADPWTGWADSVVEGVPIHFPAGYYSASTVSVPVTTSNSPVKTSITGDGSGSTFITITGGTGQFRVYGSGSGTRVLDNLKVGGFTLYAGADNTSTGLLSVENADNGTILDDIRVDPTSSYTIAVGAYLLNGENYRVGSLIVRGWSATNAAAGNVQTAVKFYTDDGAQRGNVIWGHLHAHNCTTGLSISSSGGSHNNIRFNLAKFVNSTAVDSTTAVSLASNAEQISFGDIHVEKFNTGLTATSVELIVIENGLFSQVHNVANDAGNAVNIVNGDSGRIFARFSNVYNGIVLSGTTTRYFVQGGPSTSVTGAYFTDSSSGVNTYITGQTVSSALTTSGNFTASAGFSLGATSPLTIATGAITVTTSNHGVDTEASAASDDLDTINGGYNGMLLVIRATNDARTVVAKDGTGNLLLAGDCTLDNSQDTLLLIKAGTNWIELSRSDNAA